MKILIADDEQGVRALFTHFLKRYPSPYISFEILDNGEKLRNRCLISKPDIVFTDIRMPGLSGLEAIYEIQQATQYDVTNYYIISGYDDFEYARMALRLGIKDYILKPLKYTEILAILEKEERKRFTGISIEKAWKMGNEEKALKLSALIQDLALAFEKKGKTYNDMLSDWSRTAEGNPIEENYFLEKFGFNLSSFQEQKHFLEKNSKENSEAYSKNLVKIISTMIEKNYSNPALGLDSIAEDLGYSKQYLSAIFKKEKKMLFSSYLTKTRMESATKLLHNSNIRIKDIARICGYSYVSYFIKVFRRHTGKSPEEWREENNIS